MHKCVSICLRISRAIPLVFISVIIGWSYYAYIVAMCIYGIPSSNIGEKVALIIFYHIVLGIFIWAYAKTTLAKPSLVPHEFRLTPSDLASAEAAPGDSAAVARRREFLQALVRQRGLPVLTRGGPTGEDFRVCEACRLVKPDRAHHCSTCGVCLLKMDHHCPWVNNCVGHHNYKYFLLFLFYGCLYCCYVGATSAKYFVTFWTEGMTDIQAYRFHVLFVFFAAWLFAFSLLFLGGYHAFLTLRNRTTLESSRAPVLAGGQDKRAFDVGAGRNFCQVFGGRWYLWPLPVLSWTTDGVNWEPRSGAAFHQSSYVSPTLLLDGHSEGRYQVAVDLEAST